MIFYFSGTGNSEWVARTVASAFSEEVFEIGSAVVHKTMLFSPKKDERIGFVFPVHSWGIPPIVTLFIRQLVLENYEGQLVFGIFTCGDECGYTNLQFLKLLGLKGWMCRHVYSVQMPNNYIAFPGFDVDDKPLENKKKENAKNVLTEIIHAINADKVIDCYIKGTMSFLKSRIIYSLFCKYAINSKPFYSSDLCIGCGVCVKKCPTENITIENKRPVWRDNCTQCLACIHYCPQRAIEYGRMTQHKGRYTFNDE